MISTYVLQKICCRMAKLREASFCWETVFWEWHITAQIIFPFVRAPQISGGALKKYLSCFKCQSHWCKVSCLPTGRALDHASCKPTSIVFSVVWGDLASEQCNQPTLVQVGLDKAVCGWETNHEIVMVSPEAAVVVQPSFTFRATKGTEGTEAEGDP